MTHIPMSEVSVDITAEEFIISETAKLSFSATFAMTDPTLDAKAEVLEAAKQISDGDWYITGLNRNEDSSGIETVSYSLNVRIKDSGVGPIKGKIKAVNRPGLKFALLNTDYSPTRDQIAQGNKSLRRKVYEKANEELTVLNEVVKDGDDAWIVGSIDFVTHSGNNQYAKSNMLRTANVAMYNEAAGDEEDAGGVTQKLVLTARVTFTRKIYSRL